MWCLHVRCAESAKSRQHDSVPTVNRRYPLTVGYADMKLARCAVGTKTQVEFEDGVPPLVSRLV